MNFVFQRKYDVAVVGAGVAGVAAAVAAARRGRKVALIEKTDSYWRTRHFRSDFCVSALM